MSTIADLLSHDKEAIARAASVQNVVDEDDDEGLAAKASMAAYAASAAELDALLADSSSDDNDDTGDTEDSSGVNTSTGSDEAPQEQAVDPPAEVPAEPEQPTHSETLPKPQITSSTLRAVIFNPKAFKTLVLLTGSVRMVDLEMGRMDIADCGAKLIVDLSNAQLKISTYQSLQDVERNNSRIEVEVTGWVKKRQRRTFLDATNVRIVVPGAIAQPSPQTQASPPEPPVAVVE